MINKDEIEKELKNIPAEILQRAYKKGFNPNDILCITCAYKSCMQESTGRNLISKAAKKLKKKR